MIENEEDPGRGKRGHHHGSHRPPQGSVYDSLGIHQIAVHVDDNDAGSARLDLAIHLAKAFGAELIGVGSLLPDSPASTLPPEISVSPGVLSGPLLGGRDTYGAIASDISPIGSPPVWRARIDEMERWYEDRMARAPAVMHHWRVIGHAGLDEMVSYAKVSDLTIVGQHAGGVLLPVSPGFRPEGVTMASGRPTLIVPLAERRAAIGNMVVIAWDGSREAVRAVHDSMPLLRDAVQIVILEIDRIAQDAGPELPGADAARALLERHGFQSFVETQDSVGSPTAEVLLERTTQLGADLIVAGLFHHSQLREGIFGGVSHELLHHMPIPVLVSH